MPDIRAGQITALYLFDVAESINLAAIPGLIGGQAIPARLAAKPTRPAYVQYQQPPVSFDGERVEMRELGGFSVRFRIYDYGVVSLALNRAFAGSWVELLAFGHEDPARLKDEVLRHRISYLANDLVVPSWNAALVYDTEAGAQAASRLRCTRCSSISTN